MLYAFYARLFLLIKIEPQHITGIQIPVLQIFYNLLFTIRVIAFPATDLQLLFKQEKVI